VNNLNQLKMPVHKQLSSSDSVALSKPQSKESEAMASIEDFLNQYEENNVDQARMQRWASAQTKRTRPVFFKAFVEGLS